jgi:addiction module HigA family antidote
MLADRLGISRNTLYRIRSCEYSITPAIAISLAEAFDTTPQLWLNLQQAYDLWMVSNEHRRIDPIVKNGEFFQIKKILGFLGCHLRELELHNLN